MAGKVLKMLVALGFRLPLDSSLPIVVICVGTGLALLRHSIWEFAAIANALKASHGFGKALVYF